MGWHYAACNNPDLGYSFWCRSKVTNNDFENSVLCRCNDSGCNLKMSNLLAERNGFKIKSPFGTEVRATCDSVREESVTCSVTRIAVLFVSLVELCDSV